MTNINAPPSGPAVRSPSTIAVRSGLTGRCLATISFSALVLLVLVGLSPLSAEKTVWLAPRGSDLTRQVLFIATFGLAVLGCLIARGVNAARSIPSEMWLVLGWCLLTVTWSIDPTVSLRRWGLLTIVTMIPFLNVEVLGVVRTLRILRAILIMTLVGDWISVMFAANSVYLTSEFGTSGLSIQWVGLHDNKNEAGAMMAIAGLLFVFGFAERRDLSNLLFAAAAIIFLYLTQSKTSMGLFAVSLLVGAIYQVTVHRIRARALLVLAVGLMVTGVLIAIMLNASWLLRFLEDNPEFVTGRGRLWRYVLALLSERPLFGFGYGSVWVAEMAPVDGIYRQGWTVWATHSHNGYLEVAIGTGVVGLLVALSALIVRPLLQYAWPARKPQGRDAVLFSLLSFATLHNLTEADLLMTDRWVWVVHAIVLACAYADRRLGVRGVR